MDDKGILNDWGDSLVILLRDKAKCVYCGLDGIESQNAFRQLMELDHLVPRALGGDSSLDNKVTCCRACNISKSDFDPRDPSDQLIGDPEKLLAMRIARVKDHLKKKDWNYYEKAYQVFKARLNSSPTAIR